MIKVLHNYITTLDYNWGVLMLLRYQGTLPRLILRPPIFPPSSKIHILTDLTYNLIY